MRKALFSLLALILAAAAGAGMSAYWPQGLDLISAQVARASGKAPPPSAVKPAKVVLHVNQNDPAVMNLALNNAQNITSFYKSTNQPVTIEVVAYGPGLHMLRSDTSPIKARLASFTMEQPDIRFSACENTQANMSKAEGKDVPLMSEAKVVPSGVVRLIELQQAGYAYVKP